MHERLAARQAVDHDVQEAPDHGAHDAGQDDRRGYLPTSRLTPDTLADPVMSRQEFWTMLALPYESTPMKAFSS